jgi:hypothetical protein
MDRTFIAVSLATAVLLVVGVAVGVFLGGSGLFDRQPRVDAAVTNFTSDPASCVADPDTDPTVDVGNTTRGSFLIVRTNVSVGGPNVAIETATLTETGLANYTLTYESTAGDGEACPDGERAVVRTQTVFQVPHLGGEPFGVTVLLDDERLFRLRNTSGGFEVRNATA